MSAFHIETPGLNPKTVSNQFPASELWEAPLIDEVPITHVEDLDGILALALASSGLKYLGIWRVNVRMKDSPPTPPLRCVCVFLSFKHKYFKK